MINLTNLLKTIVKSQNANLKEADDNMRSLVEHHLDDIEEALQKAFQALEVGNYKEVVDNVVIIQSSSMDAEELITGRKPEL